MVVVAAAGPGGAHKVLLISSSHSSDSNGAATPLRKRQRLTHLSPEEKALRRKLKNRVAAQTARDRKKAKMGELEQQVLELENENQKLYLENQMLRDRTSDLMSENEELRQRLGLDTLVRKEKVQVLESGTNDLVLLNGSSESAALRLRVPPQQVQAQLSSKPRSSPWILPLLALQTLSLISCLAFWTSSNQSCSAKKLRSRTPLSSSCWSDQPPLSYLPPHLELWGPHQLSWRPLMN